MDAFEEADSGNAPTAPPGAARDRARQLAGALEHERERLAAALRERTRALEESEARFHALVEGNADGIMVVDGAGMIRFANRAAAELFGIPREQLLGRPFGHPMSAGQTTEIDALPRGRPPVVMEMRVVEAQWEGRPACIACLRDVTDRKQAEESTRALILAEALSSAAKETSRRFHFLADASAALAASLDQRATLATLAHLSVAELADWTIVYLVDADGSVHRLEVVHRDPARMEAARRLRDAPVSEADAAPLREVLRTGEPRAAAHVRPAEVAWLGERLGDPGCRALEELGVASYVLLPMSARDRRLGVLALVRADAGRPFTEDDVALAQALASRAALAIDNARLYSTARAADRAKTDLIAVISHDLRTPLNSIMGYADLLEMGVGEPIGGRTADFVRRIRSSAEHQVHLIDQLLTFSRLDAGVVEFRPTVVGVGALLDDVRAIVEPLAQQAGLALASDGDRSVTVRTDPDALRQIVLNLTTNAVKYTERGEVRLEAARDGGGAIVRVRDTGIGISPEHIGRIFDPFWQAEPGRRGTGLGLSIVRRLARSLGGDVEVDSEPGRGSTFTLRLPAEPPTHPPHVQGG